MASTLCRMSQSSVYPRVVLVEPVRLCLLLVLEARSMAPGSFTYFRSRYVSIILSHHPSTNASFSSQSSSGVRKISSLPTVAVARTTTSLVGAAREKRRIPRSLSRVRLWSTPHG
ncbi:hypothetical protein OPV22_006340 [Ensete ventricosum]|uniref:Secreted protein n=1 Tax=Ensete ventricosum TaxID=4639 RepID=A0AAV8RPH0_ENSVE|nr:hypothetical protein OPV22_006340 [Ensete ventricosum]